MSKIKYQLFRGYGWICLFLALLVVVLFGIFPSQRNWPVLVTAVTGVVSFAYFVQKQKLEETRLISEFFTQFNARYDRLNDDLMAIVNRSENDPLKEIEVRILIDYFNLCAEEYLIWKQGYLYPEVWKSWFNGMKFYFRQPRICELWKQERVTESYYGLEKALEQDQQAVSSLRVAKMNKKQLSVTWISNLQEVS